MAERIVVRSSGDRRQVEEWTLVLASADISSRLGRDGSELHLLVKDADALAADSVLQAYDRDMRDRPTTHIEPIVYGRTYAGITAAICFLLFHWFTLQGDRHLWWLRKGRASAARILDGEIWRTVTALTLHVDVVHVVGNAISTAIFASVVCSLLGPGLGIFLIVVSGGVGNSINALVRGAPHMAVGASTAIFGAVGILAGLQFTRRYEVTRSARRAWIPIGAAVAILAMIGSGTHTDFLAHLFGLTAGVVLGAAVPIFLPAPPGRTKQVLLLTATVTVVACCWFVALL